MPASTSRRQMRRLKRVPIAGGSYYPSSEAERQRRRAAGLGDKGEAGKAGAVQASGFSFSCLGAH